MRLSRSSIIIVALVAAASRAVPQPTIVTWCSWDMGFAEVRGENVLLDAAAGQQFIGVGQAGAERVSAGFLSNPWLLQPVSSVSHPDALPQTYSLSQNFPNPFNPSTRIRFALPGQSFVTLTLFNILGQEITKLVDGIQEAGVHEVLFDARGFASGVYFCRIHAQPLATGNQGDFLALRKLILLK